MPVKPWMTEAMLDWTDPGRGVPVLAFKTWYDAYVDCLAGAHLCARGDTGRFAPDESGWPVHVVFAFRRIRLRGGGGGGGGYASIATSVHVLQVSAVGLYTNETASGKECDLD